MEDTFLWMPRPNTVVVKDGKPVIDCNPKIGRLISTISSVGTVSISTPSPQCLIDYDYALSSSTLYISILAGDAGPRKILEVDPVGQIYKPQKRVEYQFTGSYEHPGSAITFDSGSIVMTTGELPCVLNRAYVTISLSTNISRCLCDDTVIQCEGAGFSAYIQLVTKVSLNNTASFPINAGGRDIPPMTTIQLPDTISTETFLLPHAGSINQVATI